MLSPLDALAERVGLARASELLAVALTHSSYAAEHECESNERLEFLGDAVVDLAVADLINPNFRDRIPVGSVNSNSTDKGVDNGRRCTSIITG